MTRGLFIPSFEALAQHPKTRKAARALGVSLPTMVGHLHYLWWWAMKYATDGDVSAYEDADLADAALWEDDPGAFVKALMECGPRDGSGFLDEDYQLHDWSEFGGKLLKEKEKDRERKRSDDPPTRETATSGGNPAEIRRKTLHREEENREEERKNRGEEEQTGAALRARGHGTNGSAPPAPERELPPTVQVQVALHSQVEVAAADLLGQPLKAAQKKVINGWFNKHKAGLTPQIVEYAERETATHTDGDCLDYFFRIMERVIQDPKAGKPSKARANGHGPPAPVEPDLRGTSPPDGYSWDRDPEGNFKKLGYRDEEGLLPWKTNSAYESAQKEREHWERFHQSRQGETGSTNGRSQARARAP